MKAVRAADQPRIRWRNDGGWTRDIARDSPNEHEYSWRVSIADVETNGPFSFFPGFDRLLVLLDGVGMDLVSADNGQRMRLTSATPIARFAGEDAISAELLDGPTTDFNLIWNRSRFGLQEYDDWRDRAVVAHPGDILVVHVVAGGVRTDGGLTAVAGETMIDDGGHSVRLSGEGDAIVAVLRRHVDANQID